MVLPIILTGPMGSGKSSVGRLLAEQLGYRFVDLDALLVEQAGKSINRIFAEEGEAAFRDRETELLASLAGSERMVLATGGGAVVREQNRRLLHALGLVANLTAGVSELAQRLYQADDRPLLQGEQPLEARIADIVTERELFYADADIRIDTTGKTLEDVAAQLLVFYTERCCPKP